jgi:hypothetical protein
LPQERRCGNRRSSRSLRCVRTRVALRRIGCRLNRSIIKSRGLSGWPPWKLVRDPGQVRKRLGLCEANSRRAVRDFSCLQWSGTPHLRAEAGGFAGPEGNQRRE